MNEPKFKVELLEEVSEFLGSLNEKTRDKIIYNIRKSQIVNDNELFKNSTKTFGNLELFTTKPNTDFLLFGIKLTKPIL